MKKTVHIVIQGGCVIDAFSDADVEVVIYDLDCQDEVMYEETLKVVEEIRKDYKELEIY